MTFDGQRSSSYFRYTEFRIIGAAMNLCMHMSCAGESWTMVFDLMHDLNLDPLMSAW